MFYVPQTSYLVFLFPFPAMCTYQETHLAVAEASLKRFVWRGKNQAGKARVSFPDRERAGKTCVNFQLLIRKMDILSSTRGWVYRPHTAGGSFGLRMGATGGPCGLLPKREVLARAEESDPECLFLEAHSVGPGSLQSPTGFSFLLLILPLLGPVFCFLSWVAPGAVFWAGVRPHAQGLPQRGPGPLGKQEQHHSFVGRW